MASQVITPENLKKTIDSYVKKAGTKAFLLSTELVGDAIAPGKKNKFYRIPVAVAEDFLKRHCLPLMMEGLYLVPVKDLDLLSDDATRAYQDNLASEVDENTDINVMVKRRIAMNDVITIRKDGTLLLNGEAQATTQMDLM